MTTTELIQQPQAIEAEHGPLPVAVWDGHERLYHPADAPALLMHVEPRFISHGLPTTFVTIEH